MAVRNRSYVSVIILAFGLIEILFWNNLLGTQLAGWPQKKYDVGLPVLPPAKHWKNGSYHRSTKIQPQQFDNVQGAEIATFATTLPNHIRNSKTSTITADYALANLQLFVPAFPRKLQKDKQNRHLFVGFEELRSTLVTSLEFFWPADQLNLLVVLDDTVYTTLEEKEAMTMQVKSFFSTSPPITVAYNPRSNQTLYKSGWNIQQLIMFWADNFTNAEYIGFVDDDTIFTKAVLPYDLFDDRGRPR